MLLNYPSTVCAATASGFGAGNFPLLPLFISIITVVPAVIQDAPTLIKFYRHSATGKSPSFGWADDSWRLLGGAWKGPVPCSSIALSAAVRARKAVLLLCLQQRETLVSISTFRKPNVSRHHCGLHCYATCMKRIGEAPAWCRLQNV